MDAQVWQAIYASGFAASSVALVTWTLGERRSEIARFAPVVLLAGLVAMLATVTVAQGEAGDRLFLLARDLLVQAAMAYAVRLLVKHPEVLWPALAAAGAVYYLYYREGQRADVLRALSPPTAGAPLAPPGAPADAVPLDPAGELLVQFRDGSSGPWRAALPSGTTTERAFARLAETPGGNPALLRSLRNTFVVDLPGEGRDVRDLLDAPGDAYVERNERIAVAPVPSAPTEPVRRGMSGPRDPRDVGLDDPEASRQWALTAWPYAAFAKTTDALRDRLRPARLFVLDSGVDATHPDLAGNYLSHDPEGDRDGIGHGTHVAGIAGAVARNGLGVAGWLPRGEHEVKVSSVRVIGPFGFGTQRSIVQGIIDAANAGASVINLSLGGRSTDARQKIYAEAVRYANERGAIVVVAAGNSAIDARRYAPANTPGVIAVAALDNTLAQARFSNDIDGLEMGVWAPGQDIVSTIPGAGYAPFSGTSMAAPQVAGLLAVAKALQPGLDTRGAYRLLRRAVAPSGAGARDRPDVIDPSRLLEDLAGRG